MRVRIKGYAVRSKAAHGFDRLLDTMKRLKRETVNQIVIDARETCSARVFRHCANLLFRLNAVHNILHARVEILYAQTQAAEAEARKRQQLFARRSARVCLNGELRVRCLASVL